MIQLSTTDLITVTAGLYIHVFPAVGPTEDGRARPVRGDLEPRVLALGPPVVAPVGRVVGGGLGHHEAVETEPELADVRGHLADGEDTGRAVRPSALET